jgi:nitroimidazol reductase NimA-like FMN-containing flavoprotein (pyridoxamine 5'-phosphate oxidase superfamily)
LEATSLRPEEYMMKREVRLKENAVNAQKAIEILQNGSYGVLSTTGEDGYPYGIPLHYSYWNNCIYFHCAKHGHKLENIDFTCRVSFCVVTKSDILARKFDTDYESVVVFGRAIVVTDASEKENILMSILNKYSADYIEAGKNYIKKFWDDTKVVKIIIDRMTGKAHAEAVK